VLAPDAAGSGAGVTTGAEAGAVDGSVAGSLASTDAEGSEGSDAGELGIWPAPVVVVLAGTTTAVGDVASEDGFEHAANASSETYRTEIVALKVPFRKSRSFRRPDSHRKKVGLDVHTDSIDIAVAARDAEVRHLGSVARMAKLGASPRSQDESRPGGRGSAAVDSAGVD
jgi:hypothetical protein